MTETATPSVREALQEIVNCWGLGYSDPAKFCEHVADVMDEARAALDAEPTTSWPLRLPPLGGLAMLESPTTGEKMRIAVCLSDAELRACRLENPYDAENSAWRQQVLVACAAYVHENGQWDMMRRHMDLRDGGDWEIRDVVPDYD